MKRLLLFAVAFRLSNLGAFADLPVPPQVYNPQTPAEGWNVIRLAMGNAGRLLEENRLPEITDQVSLCSPALRALARGNPSIDEKMVVAYRNINDAAQTSLSGNRQAAELAFSRLAESLRSLEAAFAPADVQAEIFACTQHPEVLSPLPGSSCRVCAALLRVRRIPYTEICPVPKTPIARLRISKLETVLVPGTPVTLRAHLRDAADLPISGDRLIPFHGERLLFFVTDASFREFHLLRPSSLPTEPIELSFTPRFEGPHRLWAGLVPEQTGLVEYPWASLGDGFQPEDDSGFPDVVTAQVDGYTLSVSFAGAGGFPRAGELSLLRLHVADSQGRPCASLEPLDRAFAHLTGFFSDGETMIRLHPLGPDILRDELRGGPWLAFKIYPSRAGFIRLFCQLKVEGRVITAPLGIHVKEAPADSRSADR